MRASRFLIATKKETPADAEVISHQLMLRAGLIRKLASGLYNWMPMGLRVLRKVEAIVREEMDNAGAQELSMPVVQPAELWEESGRWQQYGGELLRIKDRHNRDFCLGPTHEEVITDLARNELSSYKQLPLSLFQKTKRINKPKSKLENKKTSNKVNNSISDEGITPIIVEPEPFKPLRKLNAF